MCLTVSFTAACAHRSSTQEIQTVSATAANLKIPVPSLVREPCEAAELPPGPKLDEADYQVFGARQTGRLETCEEKRALGVSAMDLHNEYVERLVSDLRPRPWWRFWR
jgi:hypothetical protein